MSEQNLVLIAGLGNPGKKYENTRHNAGFIVIDEIASTNNISCKSGKFNSLSGRGKVCNKKIILLKPLSYMNLSGDVIQKIVSYYKINTDNIIIVHDDMDIEYGIIKIKKKGGDGGHKGVKSIINSLKDDNFTRIRIGIGRSHSEGEVTDYVLGNFNSFERINFDRIVNTVCESIYTILLKGVYESMNNFNNKQILV